MILSYQRKWLKNHTEVKIVNRFKEPSKLKQDLILYENYEDLQNINRVDFGSFDCIIKTDEFTDWVDVLIKIEEKIEKDPLILFFNLDDLILDKRLNKIRRVLFLSGDKENKLENKKSFFKSLLILSAVHDFSFTYLCKDVKEYDYVVDYLWGKEK